MELANERESSKQLGFRVKVKKTTSYTICPFTLGLIKLNFPRSCSLNSYNATSCIVDNYFQNNSNIER